MNMDLRERLLMRTIRGFALFALLLLSACGQSVIHIDDDSDGGGGGGGGGGGTPTSCPSVIDYTPAGGTIARNQSVTVSVVLQTTMPSNCQIIWGTNDPSILTARGTEASYPVDGKVYYGGKTAVVIGVYRGTIPMFGKVIRLGTDGKWTFTGVQVSHTWTVN